METRFYALATFNAEVGRGLVHTPEYVKIMKQLQKEYDKLYHKGPKVDLSSIRKPENDVIVFFP